MKKRKLTSKLKRKRKFLKRLRQLEELILHAWVHSGYQDCGYKEMSTDMRKLYCKVIGIPYEERQKAHFGP